jgi:hypothetical protein
MPRRIGRVGQPLVGISEGEDQEVNMGETQESEEELLVERVFDTLQRNEGVLQHHLEEMEDHLSKGQNYLKLSLLNFQRGHDIMIDLMKEECRKQCVLS